MKFRKRNVNIFNKTVCICFESRSNAFVAIYLAIFVRIDQYWKRASEKLEFDARRLDARSWETKKACKKNSISRILDDGIANEISILWPKLAAFTFVRNLDPWNPSDCENRADLLRSVYVVHEPEICVEIWRLFSTCIQTNCDCRFASMI